MNFDDLASNFEIPPEGPTTAVLVSWIDRGEQQGKFGARRQVGVRFELVDVETEFGEPSLLFLTVFNLSMRSKTFREMAVALLGTADLKGVPLQGMVGKACKVTVIHRETDDGQTFANIASFKALKPGTKVKEPQTELTFFSLDPLDVKGLKAFETALAALPESERGKVIASDTYRELIATLKPGKAVKAVKKTAADVIDDGFPAGLG